MTDHHDPHYDAGHDEPSHGSTSKFLMVFVGLLVLTAISFTVGNSPAIMSTPAIGWTIMMAVSCMKAMLVMLFFMHLKWEANWKYVLTIPASIMSVFLLLMLFPDIKNRTDNYSETRWLYAATPQEEHLEHTPAAHVGPSDAEGEPDPL